MSNLTKKVQTKLMTLTQEVTQDFKAMPAIETEADYLAAGEFLRTRIKPGQKLVNETFRPLEKSATDHLKTIRAAKNDHLKPLNDAEKAIKLGMLVYRDKEREQARLEREAAQKALQEAGLDADTVIPMPARPVIRIEGVQFKETWSAEVTDLIKLVEFAAKATFDPSLVLMPNMKSLNAMARQHKTDLKIPGVKAVKTQGVASGSA